MKLTYLILITTFTIGNTSCHSQNKKNMQEQNNPLMCDPESGICEIPTNKTSSVNSPLVKANNTLVQMRDPKF